MGAQDHFGFTVVVNVGVGLVVVLVVVVGQDVHGPLFERVRGLLEPVDQVGRIAPGRTGGQVQSPVAGQVGEGAPVLDARRVRAGVTVPAV